MNGCVKYGAQCIKPDSNNMKRRKNSARLNVFMKTTLPCLFKVYNMKRYLWSFMRKAPNTSSSKEPCSTIQSSVPQSRSKCSQLTNYRKYAQNVVQLKAIRDDESKQVNVSSIADIKSHSSNCSSHHLNYNYASVQANRLKIFSVVSGLANETLLFVVIAASSVSTELLDIFHWLVIPTISYPRMEISCQNALTVFNPFCIICCNPFHAT